MFTLTNQPELISTDPIVKPILVNSPTQSSSIIDAKRILETIKINPPSEDNDHSAQHQTNIDDFEMKQPIGIESIQMCDFPNVIHACIGYGSSAIVYRATYLPQNKRVAIKVIDLDMFERNQIDGLRVCTQWSLRKAERFDLKFSLGSCLDIMKISFPEGLDEISIATILKQALEGLAYLHKNGHIHRDVKAGNLLMDQDGTVLLADFGVSSSLMETGERGMRKTFVGTPCWMAPEVMEQADYDYKADIWSFGITAIELATGHAPFAKLPPLKVLMMTLNNEPPTLSRETTTNKFSKAFKEMIDLCMHKDPTKRPTSEKLLQHPFFKQAKKPEWLAKHLIADIPPIECRPIKKFMHKSTASTSTDEWDFNDDKKASSDMCHALPELHVPKRHISFGHVVVRKPSHASSVSWSYTPSASCSATTATPFGSTQVTRKGRALSDDFKIEPSQIANSRHRYQGSAPFSFLTDEANKSINPSINHMGRPRHSSLHEKTPSVSFSEETTRLPNGKTLHRTISHDNNMNRKSRPHFQLSPPTVSQAISLSHHGSNASASSYPLVKEKSISHSKGSLSADLAIESRKVGRFELTTNDCTNRQQTDVSNVFARGGKRTAVPAIYHQIDELLKQNNIQKQLLSELSSALNQVPKTPSAESRPTQQELVSVVEELEQRLQSYQRENLLLQRENDTMRRQLELLKNH
ncbi:kinase-like domain-containing protein [Blakeslea trispora]|nr:kinase-like domain-containing protein [Blakeslea trispora]